MKKSHDDQSLQPATRYLPPTFEREFLINLTFFSFSVFGVPFSKVDPGMRVKIAGYETIIGYTLSLTIMLSQGLVSAEKKLVWA